jgi:hypothetical protein
VRIRQGMKEAENELLTLILQERPGLVGYIITGTLKQVVIMRGIGNRKNKSRSATSA